MGHLNNLQCIKLLPNANNATHLPKYYKTRPRRRLQSPVSQKHKAALMKDTKLINKVLIDQKRLQLLKTCYLYCVLFFILHILLLVVVIITFTPFFCLLVVSLTLNLLQVILGVPNQVNSTPIHVGI